MSKRTGNDDKDRTFNIGTPMDVAGHTIQCMSILKHTATQCHTHKLATIKLSWNDTCTRYHISNTKRYVYGYIIILKFYCKGGNSIMLTIFKIICRLNNFIYPVCMQLASNEL